MITVITPTYNRKHTISKCYDSLVNQTNKDFEWIIVDDGSTDNTKELIDRYIKENKIKIKYIFKKNGGKHTALNVGTKEAKGELIIILDSDDYLDDKAVEYVEQYWKKYKNNKKLCGITFIKEIENPFYKVKPFSEKISNMIEYKYNENNPTDMCEIIRTDLLKKYPYPEFEGEKFLSEVIVSGEISKKYDMVYVPKVICYCKYLEDGLSKNWFKLVVNSPMGARANNIMFMDKKFKFSIRLKNCIMFDVFSFIANKKILKETKMKFFAILFYIPSFFVAMYLKKKYKKVN